MTTKQFYDYVFNTYQNVQGLEFGLNYAVVYYN